MTIYIHKELTHNDMSLLWDEIETAEDDGWWLVEIKTEQYGPNHTAFLRRPAKPLPLVSDPLTNTLLLEISRVESSLTEQELKKVAHMREACRISAERFNQKPTENRQAFTELRLNAEAYFEALKGLPNRKS